MQEVMGTIKARIVQYTVIQIYILLLRFHMGHVTGEKFNQFQWKKSQM